MYTWVSEIIFVLFIFPSIYGAKNSTITTITASAGGPIVTVPEPSSALNTTVTTNVTEPVGTTQQTTKPRPVSDVQNTPLTSNVTNAIDATTVTTPKPRPEKPPKRQYPCKCVDGTCSCCTGYLLSRLNFTTFQNKLCAVMQYEPDDFEFNFKLFLNERRLYQNVISGKNPEPICLPLRRLFSTEICVRFSNIYTLNRNLHACIDFEGQWNDVELFNVSFNCIRIGANGLATVKPEEGGGLPIPTSPRPTVTHDYDDSA